MFQYCYYLDIYFFIFKYIFLIIKTKMKTQRSISRRMLLSVILKGYVTICPLEKEYGGGEKEIGYIFMMAMMK